MPIEVTDTDLIDTVAQVAVSKELVALATRVVAKKLGHRLYARNEEKEIAHDAIGDTCRRLLEKLSEAGRPQGTTLFQQERPLDEQIRNYLLKGVENYCNTRARRWSTSNEASRYGVRARKVIDGSKESLDDLKPSFFHGEQLDRQRIDALLLQRGLKAEEIDLIKARLDGQTFQEMAQRYGGTADKYRKQVKRALARAEIGDIDQ